MPEVPGPASSPAYGLAEAVHRISPPPIPLSPPTWYLDPATKSQRCSSVSLPQGIQAVPEPTGSRASTPSPRYPSSRVFPLCPSHHANTRPRAPVRHHGRRPGPRWERDWTSWPRRSGVRGTWRRSRSDGATDWCPSDTVFAQGDVCLTSPKERRMARFRAWNLRSDGRTRSRRVDLPWNRVGKVAVFHWRLSMGRYSDSGIGRGEIRWTASVGGNGE